MASVASEPTPPIEAPSPEPAAETATAAHLTEVPAVAVAPAASEQPEAAAGMLAETSGGSNASATPYIISFEAQRPSQQSAPTCLVQLAKAISWVVPCAASTRLGRTLRFYFLYVLAQMIASTAVVIYDRSQLRLLLFTVFLALQAVIIYGMMRDLERYRAITDVRRNAVELKAKLWGLASSSFLAPLWWSFDVIGAVQGPSRSETKHAIDTAQLVVSVVMLAHYLCIFVHLMLIARDAGRRLVQNMLKPQRLRAARYDSLPADRPVQAQETACSICLGEFEADERIILLPCNHVYHADCIIMWLRRSDLCPLRCTHAVLEVPADRLKRNTSERWRAAQMVEPVAASADAADAAAGATDAAAGATEDLEAGRSPEAGGAPGAQVIGASEPTWGELAAEVSM